MPPQREWFEKDYYRVLGVPEDASQKEVTRAYRKLAKENHPDAHPGREDRFKEISSAYDVLGDPEKRKEYDEVRRLGPVGAGFGGGGGGGGFRVHDVGDLGDLGDLFGGLFGRGRARRPGGGVAPQRGSDLETSLHLAFEDAVRGVTTSVNLAGDAPCSTCDGSGAAPGTRPVTCPQCGGRGVLDENQGLFSFSAPCTVCGGRGQVVETPCPTCGGSGVERRSRTVRVRIPPGVADGQRIRVPGRGGPGRNGGPPGDLYVITHVAPHPLFGRRGRHLTVTLPVTFPEAALGAEIDVPTLDGDTVTMRIPPGTRNGKTFRVKGRGVPEPGRPGDLLVTVEVAVPSRLSAEERKAIEDLAAAATESPRDRMKV